jgi:hypothetical protein
MTIHLPSNADVKTEWRYTSTAAIRLRVVVGDNLALMYRSEQDRIKGVPSVHYVLECKGIMLVRFFGRVRKIAKGDC